MKYLKITLFFVGLVAIFLGFLEPIPVSKSFYITLISFGFGCLVIGYLIISFETKRVAIAFEIKNNNKSGKYPVGSIFIIRTNEESDPLLVGSYLCQCDFNKDLPIFNINGEEQICFAPYIPWDTDLFFQLSSISYQEQCEYFERVRGI